MSASQAKTGRERPIPARRRPKSRETFLDRILRLSLALHVTVAIAWTGAARALGVPWPFLTAAALAALATLPIRGRIASLVWDRHRPRWERILVDELYFVHWCAAFGSALPIAVACVVAPARDLVIGAPLHLPTTFALGAYAAFLALAIWGVLVRRRWVAVRRLDVPIRDLPAAFEGYRIVQLSDLHIGGLAPKDFAARWTRLANAQGADLAVLTGDYVTAGVAFHDDIAEVIADLRAKDGTFASLGNHDYFGEGDPLIAKMRERGINVLRNGSHPIVRGDATLRLAAVDDTWTGRADLAGAMREVGDAPTVLLAHDPDLFEEAARLGADLVLSGHTHGGQIAVPFFTRWVNLSQLAHRRTYGRYTSGDATLYVHAGLGTTGPPIRIGAAPEIAVLTLRRMLRPPPAHGEGHVYVHPYWQLPHSSGLQTYPPFVDGWHEVPSQQLVSFGPLHGVQHDLHVVVEASGTEASSMGLASGWPASGSVVLPPAPVPPVPPLPPVPLVLHSR